MDENKIRERIANNYYRPRLGDVDTKLREDYIFDENKSVKWNREEVKKHNDLVEFTLEEYKKALEARQEEFDKDVINFIIEYFGFNNKVAKRIFDKAYEDGHPYGHNQVLNDAISISVFTEEILRIDAEK